MRMELSSFKPLLIGFGVTICLLCPSVKGRRKATCLSAQRNVLRGFLIVLRGDAISVGELSHSRITGDLVSAERGKSSIPILGARVAPIDFAICMPPTLLAIGKKVP